VWALTALAFSLRLWAVLTLPAEERVLRADAVHYDRLAISLIEGRGFAWPAGGVSGYYPLPEGPTSSRPPGYPAFVAVIYAIFGHNPEAVRVAQCAVGALLCPLTYAIAASAAGPLAGVVAAAITAVYPPFIRFSYYGGPGLLLSEGLFMVLLAAGLWQLGRLAQQRRFGTAVAAGAWLGLATLTRPVTLFFPAAILLWAASAPRPDRRRAIAAAFAVCAAFALTILPWTIRNWQVHHRLVPVSTVSGKALWAGNNPHARGGAVELNLLYDPATYDPASRDSEVDRAKAMEREAVRFWREHPQALPKLFVRKLLMFWNVYDVRYNVAYALLLPWALLGVAALWRGPGAPVGRLLVALLAYVSVMTVVFFGSTRFRYPFEPAVIILAAAGLVWAFTRARRKWVPAATAAVWVGVNGLLFLWSDALLAGLRGLFAAAGMR
jgi:4-amino-4-deoxy-L-arabinose transferase-like glycosyltransferase